MKVSRRTLVLLFAMCLTTVGCSSHRPPTIAVGAARFTDASAEALRFDVDVDMANPNPEPLSLHTIRYTVTVDGQTTYHGSRSAEATLGAGGGKRIILPVIIRFEQRGWSAGTLPGTVSFSLTGSLEYSAPETEGSILLDLGASQPSTSFAGDGEVMLRGADSLSEPVTPHQ